MHRTGESTSKGGATSLKKRTRAFDIKINILIHIKADSSPCPQTPSPASLKFWILELFLCLIHVCCISSGWLFGGEDSGCCFVVCETFRLVHEPKHSVIAFSSTHEQLRAAGESDSVSIEKHHVFKRKCSREGAKGQLGFLRSQWHPSLQAPTLSGCRPILGHPVAWERGLR